MLAAVLVAVIALPPKDQAAVVAEARKALDVPYVLGGRLRDGHDGLDCQGLVFFALQAVSKCGWRSWSVMPTTSVKGELGLPIGEPMSSRDLDVGKLEPGDVIWFVDPLENPAESAIGKLDGVDVWVWHTALYTGDGRFISGDPFAGKVNEEELVPYAKLHYAGLVVTRMKDGPHPANCRAPTPMRRRG